MISDLLKLFANLDCRLCKKIPYQNVRYNKEITTFYTYLLLQLEDNKNRHIGWCINGIHL